MAPDKIYIFQDGDELWYKPEEWETPPPGRVEYIRKDAMLEFAQEELSKESASSSSIGRRNAFIDVVDKLNSM